MFLFPSYISNSAMKIAVCKFSMVHVILFGPLHES